MGSLASVASQLPIFVMRKQELVDRLFNERRLDPSVIGIKAAERIRWKNFYDIDDVLGFPTRRLYEPNAAIKEFQIDCGDQPGSAHTEYWENDTVIRETANLFDDNCR